MNDDAATKRLDVLICIGAVIVAFLVDPRGDFPLSDDWSYAHTARVLCESGHIEFLPWTGASVLFQAAYGALLCKITGFSFTVLRISTIAMAAIGALGFNHLLAHLRIGLNTRRLAVAVFALNPLYVSQSFTFMTDVPFTALSLVAAVLYIRGLSTADTGRIVLGSLIASAAILIRQHAVFVVAAAVIAPLLAREKTMAERGAQSAAAGTIPLMVFIAFHAWLFGSHGAPAGLENKLLETSLGATVAMVDHTFRAAVTLGFALSPLAILGAKEVFASRRPMLMGLGALLGLAALVLYANDGSSMFYLPNVMFDFGLGAPTLRDSLFLALAPSPQIGPALTFPLTALSLAATAAVAVRIYDRLGRIRDPASSFVLLAAIGLFAGSLLLHGAFYFDRYLIPAIPFAIAAFLLGETKTRIPVLASMLAVLLAVYAVAGTHDYLSMNRARYSLLADLERSGVGSERIDGGFEYNAWHRAAQVGDWPTKESARRGQSPDTKSWWWVHDDEYIVSSVLLEGYQTTKTAAYATWLKPERGRILLLERSPRP